MNMIATVATKEKAWQLADKLFPTDYSRNEPDSLRAGYPIFNTTSTDSKYKGFHISDLNAALELNMGAETMEIRSEEQNFSTHRRFCFAGKEDGNVGVVEIEIRCKEIVTSEIARKLDELATEQKAKEIIEGQEAPQQFKPEEGKTAVLIDEWINQYGQNCEHLRSAGGSPSKSEQ